MEPPPRTRLSVQLQPAEETKQFLESIANFPDEIIIEILYRTDYQRLMAICKGLQTLPKSQRQKYGWLVNFCDDVNFWRDWLIEQGYDLPETLPQTLRVLREEGQTDLNLIQKIFFQDQLLEVGSTLIRLLKKPLREEFIEDAQITREETIQATLDLDYLEKQIQDRQLRKDGQPRVFVIELFVTDEQYANLELPEELSAEELIQWIVNHDLEEMPLFTIRDEASPWVKKFFTRRFYHSTANLTYLVQKLGDQTLATLPFFLREGDLVSLSFVDTNTDQEESIDYSQKIYYVGPKGQLYKTQSLNEEEEAFFPEEALPFLKKHQITNHEQLFKLYPRLVNDQKFITSGPYGYTENEELIEFE